LRKAIIDVGSNSVLLLIAEKKNNDWIPIFETSEVTGLGEGIKVTGGISEGGMVRTLEALQRAFQNAEMHDAPAYAFGTMALRIAENAQDFLERAERQGTPVKILSGEEEAELGAASVFEDPAFRENPVISMIDVGGHSTEIVTKSRGGNSEWKTRYQKSYAIGTLGLRDEILKEESPNATALLRAIEIIDNAFGIRYLPSCCGKVVAVGASAVNLVTIRDKLLEWDAHKVHGAVLTYEEISTSCSWLCKMTDSERAKVPGLERGRERTIHIGALILERALFALGADTCSVSTRGWRYALLSRL